MVNGKEVAKGQVPVTAAFTFTANDCLDFGIDLGSPVSIDYYDKAPFRFNGTIGTSKIWYPEK
jgi:arylsulfatase